jgi:hypothetical protein
MVQPADELVWTYPHARSKRFAAQVRSTTPFEMTLAKPTAAINWVRKQVHNAARRKGISGRSGVESGSRHQYDQDLT